MTQSAIATLSRALNRPIYWAGPKPGFTYEVIQTSSARFFVRYLPRGVKVGDSHARFLIIATYPFPNALSALKAVAGGQERAVPGGGIAVVDKAYPKSVHMAFPGVDYEIEVFDPSPKRSLSIALSGDVKPIR